MEEGNNGGPDYTALGGERQSSMAALVAFALLAGLANGYNGTVLEGAIPRLRVVGMISDAWQSGLLAAGLSIGGLAGSIACTSMAYRLSRRNLVIAGEAVIVVSVLCFACSSSFTVALLGRICTGFGVGICGLAKPLIVSEQCAPQHRGLLVSLFSVGQSIGLNVFYLTDWALPPSSIPWAWRILVAVGAAPAVFVVGLAFLPAAAPTSAYWDVPPRTAPKVGSAKSAKGGATQQLMALLTKEPASVRRNFLLIVAMMLGYNLSGTLVIANYASEIFAEALNGHTDGARGLAVFVGAVQFLGLISAAVLVDRIGRRPLLLGSCFLTFVCLYSIAALIGLKSALAPALGELHTPLLLSLMVAVEYAVGAGLSPIRVVLSAELMPNAYRPLGMALGNAVGWALALLSLFFFPVLSAMLGGPAPQFCFFGTVVAGLTILLFFQLPETKGIDFGA